MRPPTVAQAVYSIKGSCKGVSYWASRGEISICCSTQPRTSLAVFSLSRNGGISWDVLVDGSPYYVYYVYGRTCLPKLRSNTWTQGNMFLGTHAQALLKKKHSKGDSNPCSVVNAKCEGVTYLCAELPGCEIDLLLIPSPESKPYDKSWITSVAKVLMIKRLMNHLSSSVFLRIVVHFVVSSWLHCSAAFWTTTNYVYSDWPQYYIAGTPLSQRDLRTTTVSKRPHSDRADIIHRRTGHAREEEPVLSKHPTTQNVESMMCCKPLRHAAKRADAIIIPDARRPSIYTLCAEKKREKRWPQFSLSLAIRNQ